MRLKDVRVVGYICFGKGIFLISKKLCQQSEKTYTNTRTSVTHSTLYANMWFHFIYNAAKYYSHTNIISPISILPQFKEYIQRIYLCQAQRCRRTDIIILCSLGLKRKTLNSRLSERRVLKNPALQGTQKLETSYSGPSPNSSVTVPCTFKVT